MTIRFTSEQVLPGHPDKVCDLIADSILDYALERDPEAKMAVEVTVKDDFVLVFGEKKTTAEIPYKDIVEKVYEALDYPLPTVQVMVSDQSQEINDAVCQEETAAGDQGIMFGYATDESADYLPAAQSYANKLAHSLFQIVSREPFLHSDGKVQITYNYDTNKVDTVVVSVSHDEGVDVRPYAMEAILHSGIPVDDNTEFLINPSGSFSIYGPVGDSGTTGRKIVCDTYGGSAPIGGGCFSSKDPSKVDRSAAYYARYVAKNIVANGLAKKCLIQVAYAIGKKEPVSLNVECYGTANQNIEALIREKFNFNVENIIRELDLKKPIYSATSVFGHFGRDELPWERIIEL